MPSSLLQLIQQYLHVKLRFPLNCEVKSFLLEIAFHRYCMITQKLIQRNIISKSMFLKYLNKLKFSQFYHPTKFTINLELIQKGACQLANYVGIFRSHGHHYANLDPLSLYNQRYEEFIRPTDINLKFQDSPSSFKFITPLTSKCSNLEQLQILLKKVYLGTTGVEFEHVASLEEKDWLYNTYQTLWTQQIPNQIKIKLAKELVQAEALDIFLQKKWGTFKRYSGQGAQSTSVALQNLFAISSKKGYQHIVFGMPHRGRLNVLVNVLQYQSRNLFKKISGKTDTPFQLNQVIDDVTSHLAQSITKSYDGNKIKVTLVHNPSHLQAQNPVTMGKTYSKQLLYGKDKVLNIQVHGDAAVCAQGVVMQSLCLANTPNFSVNGTIHIITNNQIGYTTRPIDSRPSKYATDLFKAFDTPVLHVNSQNIEDVYRAVQLALDYQIKFKKDVMIDLICYRKYGHNEVDEPEFTQPKMYHKIRKIHKPNPIKYTQILQKQGLLQSGFYENTIKAKSDYYQQQYKEVQNIQKINLKEYTNPKTVHTAKAFTELWKDMKPSQYGQQYPTAFNVQNLKEFALASCYYPQNFNIHPRIRQYHIQKRLKAIQQNALDWATCEALALFSLNYQGYNIRLTGQDVERGTFSQRHLNLTDQKTQQTFNPLQFFAQQQPGRGQVQIFNSALTQNAAMSFQYGYYLDNPNNFAIWEAQFGDFFNTAQVAVDVFLTCSENKWLRQTGLTLILPHGFDGAGPQHSSCRIQRFLQLANSDGSLKYRQIRPHDPNRAALDIKQDIFYENIQEANFSLVFPTKPSNAYHVLRRQMKRNFRKPLVIAGPKGLLRHSGAISKIQQMGPGTSFQPILPYKNNQNINQSKVVFITSGKFVYNIQQLIVKKKSKLTCLLAIEELFPFPETQLQEILSTLPKDAQVFWVQEQNFNGGAYQFVQNRIARVLSNLSIQKQLKYVGRRAIASTAVGSSEIFNKQAEALNKWIDQLIV